MWTTYSLCYNFPVLKSYPVSTPDCACILTQTILFRYYRYIDFKIKFISNIDIENFDISISKSIWTSLLSIDILGIIYANKPYHWYYVLSNIYLSLIKIDLL